MDLSRLSVLTEKYRVLTGQCSLPFVILNNGEKTICWFNYFLDQEKDNFSITISSIFTLANDESVFEHKLRDTIQAKIKEVEEPPMEEDEYYAKFENVYAEFSNESMENLLRNAESSLILPAYERVVQLLKEK